MEKSPPLYFPLFVDLSEKRILVIGGGKIAQRRIETLLDFATDICVVAPEITDKLRILSENRRIQWIQDVYHTNLTEGADIVLAATNSSSCNDQIAADCKARKIPVNTAHKKESCDFYFPGIVRQGNIVTGISTSGLNHHEAKEARERISQALGTRQI